MKKIGIISDTHNLLRPEISEILQGCDSIIHAGDVSSRKILDQLSQMAPLMVVRGNNDKEWAEDLPDHLDFELEGLRFYVTHKKKDLPSDLRPYDLAVIGHSHQYAGTWVDHKDGCRTLLINPGSCGPRRFFQAITMAVLTIDKDGFTVKRVDLPHSGKEGSPKPDDMKRIVATVVNETQKGRSVEEIAGRTGYDTALVEQVVRLYVTHPGVTVEGILTKMGM